jgi:hypothetical protein
MTEPLPTPRALADALARAGVADVLCDDGSRARYSSDASLYRVVPTAVVRPRDADEVEATLDVARLHGVPVVARGVGTSVAGNAISTGIVLDFSRHMDAVLEIDPEARTARVQPGAVQARLQAAARVHGLLFGPDPSTMSRCTIGGWDTDRRLVERANAEITVLSGCCGPAGDFGVERGHDETSVAVAEQHLLPAIRRQPDAVVLAGGFSCRTQLGYLADRHGRHLAEILADALDRESSC